MSSLIHTWSGRISQVRKDGRPCMGQEAWVKPRVYTMVGTKALYVVLIGVSGLVQNMNREKNLLSSLSSPTQHRGISESWAQGQPAL